jgi:periplasmic divalent cation tolerance protein
MSETEFVVVLATCDSVAEADRIAGRLVRDKLAACVSINDRVTSIYEWQGKIERNIEALILIKTRRSLVDELQAVITAESSYDCPEIIVLPIVAGSREYFRWLEDVTKS